MTMASLINAVVARVVAAADTNSNTNSTSASSSYNAQDLIVASSSPSSLSPSPSTWEEEEKTGVAPGRSSKPFSFRKCLWFALFLFKVVGKGVDVALKYVKEGGLILFSFGRRV